MDNIIEIAGLLLFLIGLYGLAARRNIIKSIISLGIMDIGIILFFLGIRYVPGSRAPIGELADSVSAGNVAAAVDSMSAGNVAAAADSASAGNVAAAADNLASAGSAASAGNLASAGSAAVQADAVPQALMITAIVIGVAVTAVALMMFIALYHRYGTTNWKTAHNIRKEERRN